ncbi:innate immunity activator protein isoform X2 [Tamandua tetradactyla]|uniref:innate immunity activator protein isoform X2 n=1 Tax=Tamandua tetradactyla TaxID=48850 RepID=UPI0040543435
MSCPTWGNSRPPTRPGSGWERCRSSPRCAPPSRKSTMESKDEVSDADSGIILQCGPDSPVSPKELTYAMRKQQRALEERLEACLEELRRLCLREAELTGTLPAEYPLKPGENAPKVRRRIGAAYKLDERALCREDPLSSLEQELALQLQITEAARRLCREENISRQARRQRKHAMLQEEKKLRELERCLGEQRPNGGPPPATTLPLGRELSASDDSSLSDGLLLEDEESPVPKPPPESPAPPSRPLAPQSLEGLQPARPETGVLERAPIQNSPWKETSLDHPYEKLRKSPSEPSSESSSPATTPQEGPSTSSPWLLEPVSYHVVPIRGIPGQRQGRASAPTTPEMQGRRGQSQSLRVDSFRARPEGRGRSAFPRRRPTHYTVTVPDSCFPAAKPPLLQPAYHSCSEDSGSDVSSISHPTSPGSSSPDISFLRPLSPPEPPRHHGAWGPTGGRELATHYPKLLLPPGYYPAGRYVVVAEGALPPGEWELCRAALGPAYKEEGAPLRYQRLVPAHSRIVRTPSLKDSSSGRGLSKAAVSEELKWWHERARLRSARPHSLDRQGAFRVRSLPPGREGFGRVLGPRTQVPTVCVLRRSPEGAPVQVFVPENGEIISQV